MPIVDMKGMLDHAYCNGYAVGAFDVVSLDFLTGIMSAAERCRTLPNAAERCRTLPNAAAHR
ncbi:MAG: class II fructose-bisphosphate aldolase [Candidatus Thiodiazotropha endolucinida]